MLSFHLVPSRTFLTVGIEMYINLLSHCRGSNHRINLESTIRSIRLSFNTPSCSPILSQPRTIQQHSPFSDLPSFIRVLFVSRCPIPTLSIATCQAICEPVYSTPHSPHGQLTPPPLDRRAHIPTEVSITNRDPVVYSSVHSHLRAWECNCSFALFSSFSNSYFDPLSLDPMTPYLYPCLS